MPTETELPRYKCHKEVHALKIAEVAPFHTFQGGAIITPSLNAYMAFEVDKAYMEKHDPKVGGYFVVYEDGYQSFSPAKAFEASVVGVDIAADEE